MMNICVHYFLSEEDVKASAVEWFNENEFFNSGITELVYNGAKCVLLEGNYIKKIAIFIRPHKSGVSCEGFS